MPLPLTASPDRDDRSGKVIAALCGAMVADARRSLAKARLADLERPIGEKRLDTRFYTEAERDRPAVAYDFVMDGRRYKGRGAWFAVWRVRWTGDEWRQYRRISGPIEGVAEANKRMRELAAKLGMECVP